MSSRAMREAKAKHEKWLMKMGAHPTQLKKIKRNGTLPLTSGITKVGVAPTSDMIPANGTKPVDMSKAIFAKENYTIAPAYNKGAYQVIGKSEVEAIGKK